MSRQARRSQRSAWATSPALALRHLGPGPGPVPRLLEAVAVSQHTGCGHTEHAGHPAGVRGWWAWDAHTAEEVQREGCSLLVLRPERVPVPSSGRGPERTEAQTRDLAGPMTSALPPR